LSDQESNQERGASKQLAPQSRTRDCIPIYFYPPAYMPYS
jgi:hypothetical protein